MYRRTLFIFLTACVFWGISAAVPGSNIAQERALSSSAVEAQAMMVIYNTERLTLARQNRAKGLVPAGHDEELSQIHARGPMLAQQDNSEGPALTDQGEDAGDAPDTEKPSESGDASESAPIPKDQEALYQEVRELRDIVDELREEARARERLRVTEEEERDEEEEILEAAGREYSLKPPWEFSMNLSMSYSYWDYDVIRFLDYREGERNVEYHSNHNIDSSFSLESGVRDNLSAGASVPFVYKYDRVGTDESKDVNDLGDISLRLKYQPLKTGRGYPSPIFSLSYTFPTGRSSYEINPDTELSTGSGLHSVSGSVSVSQPFDPVNAFGSLSYRHRMRETEINQRRGRGILDEVDPGDTISASLGFGYAVSYRMSMSLSLSASYGFSTDYYWLGREGRDKTSSGDSISASLGLNTSWRVTPKRTIIIGVGKGLTTANPGFSLSTRIPISLDLR